MKKKLETLLAEKRDETAQNGEIFDREAYLKNVEEFEDVEVVVSGRSTAASINKLHVSFMRHVMHVMFG